MALLCMWKLEFLRMKYLLTLLLFLPLIIQAETNSNKLWSAYVNGDINTVIESRKNIMSFRDKSHQTAFLKAIFIKDGDRALSVYQNIVSNAKDGELRYHAAKKIYEYYYARGFYITADDLKKRMGFDKIDIVSVKGNPNLELPPIKYVIQIGAFSDKKNAEKMIKRISNLKATIMIKTKNISGRELHLVWVGPFTERQKAEDLAVSIKENYQIQPRIKTMD